MGRWSQHTTNQGTIRNWERGLEEILLWHFQREHSPADTLISAFQPPDP